jgi:hypothetical protein
VNELLVSNFVSLHSVQKKVGSAAAAAVWMEYPLNDCYCITGTIEVELQYLTQVVGSCCFLILRCWHQGLAKMLL